MGVRIAGSCLHPEFSKHRQADVKHHGVLSFIKFLRALYSMYCTVLYTVGTTPSFFSHSKQQRFLTQYSRMFFAHVLKEPPAQRYPVYLNFSDIRPAGYPVYPCTLHPDSLRGIE